MHRGRFRPASDEAAGSARALHSPAAWEYLCVRQLRLDDERHAQWPEDM